MLEVLIWLWKRKDSKLFIKGQKMGDIYLSPFPVLIPSADFCFLTIFLALFLSLHHL